MTSDNLIVVLHRPQKLVNIGGAVRAMKNMGLRRLRLVAPAEFEPADITGIAHRSDDMLASAEIYGELDAALADATYVVGTTARRRGAFRHTATPRELAPELLARTAAGPVALLFGPEDNGLANAELDRCHALVTISTDPSYPSLNLAQAVLLLAYELRMATPAGSARQESYPPANRAQLDIFFQALEHMLRSVAFLKGEHAESVMRSLRNLTHRAEPNTREAALLTAICREVEHYVQRNTRSENKDEEQRTKNREPRTKNGVPSEPTKNQEP
jgi:tRNA/rRNA methyltransferase